VRTWWFTVGNKLGFARHEDGRYLNLPAPHVSRLDCDERRAGECSHKQRRKPLSVVDETARNVPDPVCCPLADVSSVHLVSRPAGAVGDGDREG
jgi:hypothetical protein